MADLKDQLQVCTTTKFPLALRNFAPEIWSLILKYCVWPVGYNKFPPIVTALRGDNELYQEALKIFYGRTCHILSPHTTRAFDALPRVAVENISMIIAV